MLISLSLQFTIAKLQSVFDFASLQSLSKRMLLILISKKSGSTTSDWMNNVETMHIKCGQVETNLWISDVKQMIKVCIYQKSFGNMKQSLTMSRVIMILQFGAEYFPQK